MRRNAENIRGFVERGYGNAGPEAAASAVPEDPPHKKPSSLTSLLAHAKASSSPIFIHSSTFVLSATLGIKSYPIPSTLYPPSGTSLLRDSG